MVNDQTHNTYKELEVDDIKSGRENKEMLELKITSNFGTSNLKISRDNIFETKIDIRIGVHIIDPNYGLALE